MKPVQRRLTSAIGGLAVLCFLGPMNASIHAEETRAAPAFAKWDVEQYRTGLVALSRADDHRSAILIFCTLIGTRNVVYAYDGRGQRSEDIPISQVRVLATPTVEVFGVSMPSSVASFANDGNIIRMRLPLPQNFVPPYSERMSIESGPDAAPENHWSVEVGDAGLEDALRVAFKNCV
jgi:hypothetical protein